MASIHQTCLEAQCRGAISLMPIFFTIVSGQIRTQSDDSLRSILCPILSQLSGVDDCLHILSTDAAKKEIVDAIYDSKVLPLVNGDGRAAEMLGPQEKARLLAEGIAACISLAIRLSRLDTIVSMTTLRYELHKSATARQLLHIRDTMEQSHLFSDCLMMSQIVDLIFEASHDVNTETQSKCASFHDYEVDAFSAGYEKPSRNMGQPWGFTFMVLN